MTDSVILTNAIKKAIAGGWPITSARVTRQESNGRLGITWDGRTDSPVDVETIIFNHDFAKALWGEQEGRQNYIGRNRGREIRMHKFVRAWQWHLQQMVVADVHIKYLGENL